MLGSCSKPDNQPPSDPQVPTSFPKRPIITDFEIGDLCSKIFVIEGDYFNPDISKDSIFFGGLKGIIDSATKIRIFARCPPGNINGSITVYSNGLPGVSKKTFSLARPVILSFKPEVAGPGALVTITGNNFNANPSMDSVFFGDVKATIVSAKENMIVAAVPKNATSGKIRVVANCDPDTTDVPFTVSNKGAVYVAGNDGFVYAIDIASASVMWKVFISSSSNSGPAYDNGIIYIGSTDPNHYDDNYMYALDAITGAEIWKFRSGPWEIIPTINQGVLYAGSYGKKFYALDQQTGQTLWTFDQASSDFRIGSATYYNGNIYTSNGDWYFYSLDASTGQLNWKTYLVAGGNPAVVNGVVYTIGMDAALANSYLYALDAATGQVKWQKNIPDVNGSPTVVNGVVYIGTGSHRVFALNAETGQDIWQAEVGWWVQSAPIVAGDILYVTVGDGSLAAIDVASGNLLWEHGLYPNGALGGLSPAVANDMVFAVDVVGRVYALDAKTGETKWWVQTATYPISSPCVVDSSGKVHYSGESGSQQ